MANQARGEVAFAAGERTYTLRPTFEALCEIEHKLNAGLVEIAERIVARKYGVHDVTAILHAGARSADATVSEEEIGAAIVRAGLRPAMEAALDFLVRALSGADEEKKPARPPQPPGP